MELRGAGVLSERYADLIAELKKDGTIVAVEETPNNSRHINSPMIRTINGDGKIFLMLLESR